MSKITMLTVNRIKFVRAVSEALAWMVEPDGSNRVAYMNKVRESYAIHPETHHFSDPLFAQLFEALDNHVKVIFKNWLLFSKQSPSMVSTGMFFFTDDNTKVSFGMVNCTFIDVCNAPTLEEWVKLK